MDNMVDFILNGAMEFTPEVLVRLFVFVLALDTIGFIARAILKVGE